MARLRNVPPFILHGFLQAHRELVSAPFLVSEVRLYASELTPTEARHSVRRTFALESSAEG